jgi:hypothetical protein
MAGEEMDRLQFGADRRSDGFTLLTAAAQGGDFWTLCTSCDAVHSRRASRHSHAAGRWPARTISPMPKPTALELTARFVAVLYAATNGQPGQFRRIDDCAQRAGIKRPADVTRAVATAEAAGLIVVRADEPLVTLTAMGRQAAQRGQGGGR